MAQFWIDAAVPKVLSLAIFSSALSLAGVAAAEPPAGGRIGYVLTERHWAVYETDGAKQECTQGMSERGSRAPFD